MKKHKTTFKRLVSNLPYNPSLISQVSFYAKRLKQESSIRRLGFVFIALTFFVQLFAVIAPPQHSLARDTDNDLYTGGFASKDQVVSACDNNVRDYANIIAYTGATCDNVRNGTPVTIRSTDFGGQLMSMGRKPYGKANEQPFMINGTVYFIRSLWAWDTNGPSTYQALAVNSPTGTFYLLYDCGNMTTVGPPRTPPPVQPKPVKTVSCSALLIDRSPNEVLKVGDTVKVTGQVSGNNMDGGDTVDMAYDYINSDTGTEVVPPVRVNGNHFNNGVAVDQTKHPFVMNTPGHYTFRMAAVYNGVLVPGSFVAPCAGSVSVAKPIPTCKDNPNLPQCLPCKDAKPGQDASVCVVKSKTANNVTTGEGDANNTTAHAGDVINYFLYTKNTGKQTVKKYAITESMSDVLDYADITDLHGGSIDQDNIVHWPLVDIKAGETITHQITVKVKTPIPITPVSKSNPGKFDLIMTNVYGNTINIKLPPPPVKVVEQTTTTLPNTGPGENVAIAFGITAVVGYFFARSRLLNKELDLVRQDYAAGEA